MPHPLPNAEEPETARCVVADGTGGVEAYAVVADGDHNMVLVSPDRHRDTIGPGVFHRVDQQLAYGPEEQGGRGGGRGAI